ncbi:hypothetical protein F4604DRAFT_1144570 [Suillus subluteus]|nr:hypothetical protein F4604DRAFT_1144570 [Suillus subluteus]
MEDAMGIDAQALQVGAFQRGMRNTGEKLQWASTHVTTVPEDIVNSLSRIFGVYIPAIHAVCTPLYSHGDYPVKEKLADSESLSSIMIDHSPWTAFQCNFSSTAALRRIQEDRLGSRYYCTIQRQGFCTNIRTLEILWLYIFSTAVEQFSFIY